MSKNDEINVGLLDKIMVSARIPKYVKKYANDNKISISDLIMLGFDSYRENDEKHAIERLRYHENRVLHWKGCVLHNEQMCNTKLSKCNTIKSLFEKQGRGNPEHKNFDKNWLKIRAEKLLKEGIPITVEELYEFCIKKHKEEK